MGIDGATADYPDQLEAVEGNEDPTIALLPD